MKIKSILSAILLMVSSVASAQYLNIQMEDGIYSFKNTSKMKVSFGAKKGTDMTESAQSVTVNGHTVTVKLADDTTTSDVWLFTYVEGENVKILAFSTTNKPFRCTRDDNAEVPAPNVGNGVYTFTLSNISKDIVATVEYDQFTIKLDLLSHGGTTPEDISVMRGAEINVTPSSDDGYEFRGWYMNESSCVAGTEWSWDKIKANTSGDIKLYAKWVTKINGHDCVKLGGYYWATENVYGKGDNHNDAPLAKPGSIHSYYETDKTDNALNAAKSWGGTWTLPNEAQFEALLKNCSWSWKWYPYNGQTVPGMFVTGKKENGEEGHSIFLPAAGTWYPVSPYTPQEVEVKGTYWSRTEGSGTRRYLGFSNGDRNMYDGNPMFGMSVRPVSE